MVSGTIQLGYKAQAWFDANPTKVLKAGQPVFLLSTQLYKIGDGSTQLSALKFSNVFNNIVLKDNASTPHNWKLTIDQTGSVITEDLGVA